jgi:ankyrin repeat protein
MDLGDPRWAFKLVDGWIEKAAAHADTIPPGPHREKFTGQVGERLFAVALDGGFERVAAAALKAGEQSEVFRWMGRSVGTLTTLNSGSNLLHWAAATGNEKALRLLLPFVDAKAMDDMGQTAIFCAAMSGSVACAQLLIEWCDPRATNKQGVTPLMRAVWRGGLECSKVLWAVSDPGARDHDGETLLMWAASGGLPAVAPWLIASGAPGCRVDEIDNKGWTPLMHAINYGQKQTVGDLASLSDLSAKDEEGNSPMDMAREAGDWCVLALQEAKARQEARALAGVVKSHESSERGAHQPETRRPRSL